MHAGELAAPHPTVDFATPAYDAAALMGARNLPGLVVADQADHPSTVPRTPVMPMALPQCCQDDPPLARLIDKAPADVFLRGPGDRTVEQCQPPERCELRFLDAQVTVLEMAPLRAPPRNPRVTVANADGTLRAVITPDALLDRILGP